MYGFVAGILHWKLVTAYIDPNFQVSMKIITIWLKETLRSAFSPST
jgi:hypothetical protein